LVAELTSVTVTFGSAAPPASVTAPPSAPVVADWQRETEGQATARAVTSSIATSCRREAGGMRKPHCSARAGIGGVFPPRVVSSLNRPGQPPWLVARR